jgi:antitoxin CcdA
MSSAPRKTASKSGRLAKRDRRVPTPLLLRVHLVERAKSLGLNLSELVEATLEQASATAEQLRWLAENEKAIEYYNSFVEEHGLFGEEFREL